MSWNLPLNYFSQCSFLKQYSPLILTPKVFAEIDKDTKNLTKTMEIFTKILQALSTENSQKYTLPVV